MKQGRRNQGAVGQLSTRLAEIEGKQSQTKGLKSAAFDFIASNDHFIARYMKKYL